MEIVKCCQNCKWLGEFPKKNSYKDVEYVCIRSGMSFCKADLKKDLTKYGFTQQWTRDKCSFEPKNNFIEV